MTDVLTKPAAAAKAETAQPILAVKNIEVIYDHVILVLKGVSLEVPEGGIVAILGANGAGKSTTLKSISNLVRSERGDVTKGRIEFKGERVDGLTPNDLVQRGCIQVMEGRHCFGHLTVEENLLTGAFTRRDGRAAVAADLEMVYAYFPRLKERRTALAGYTSGGEQQMTAIGRARHQYQGARQLPARRAEHQRGAALCQLRLYPGERAGGDGRRVQVAARE